MESASLHMEGPLDAGQVLIFFQDELDLGMAEADLAYQLSAARPDIFEGCFVKEGRAAILLPSCEGICSCTLFAHLHLDLLLPPVAFLLGQSTLAIPGAAPALAPGSGT